jgi:hypothetical protein
MGKGCCGMLLGFGWLPYGIVELPAGLLICRAWLVAGGLPPASHLIVFLPHVWPSSWQEHRSTVSCSR